MCPLSCEIVKKAIKLHEKYGEVVGRYVDGQKTLNKRCQLCTRNEKAASPVKDMGIEQEGEQ